MAEVRGEHAALRVGRRWRFFIMDKWASPGKRHTFFCWPGDIFCLGGGADNVSGEAGYFIAGGTSIRSGQRRLFSFKERGTWGDCHCRYQAGKAADSLKEGGFQAGGPLAFKTCRGGFWKRVSGGGGLLSFLRVSKKIFFSMGIPSAPC